MDRQIDRWMDKLKIGGWVKQWMNGYTNIYDSQTDVVDKQYVYFYTGVQSITASVKRHSSLGGIQDKLINQTQRLNSPDMKTLFDPER